MYVRTVHKYVRMSTHTSVPIRHMTLLHMHWTCIEMALHLFNVRCCGVLLGQCLLKVGCLLNGVQQELHFNVTFSCSHLLAKLYPVFGQQTRNDSRFKTVDTSVTSKQ